jgi:histone deacetylase complex regulatory component SIN3
MEARTSSRGAGGVHYCISDDGRRFLERVRRTFKSVPAVEVKFLNVMAQFQMQKLNKFQLCQIVSTLFQGHPDLIAEFYRFCPIDASDHFSSSQREQHAPERVVYDWPMGFLNRVKLRLRNQPDVFKNFLETVEKCRIQEIDSFEMFERVRRLFQEHEDLFITFSQFFPIGYVRTKKSPTSTTTSQPQKAAPISLGVARTRKPQKPVRSISKSSTQKFKPINRENQENEI